MGRRLLTVAEDRLSNRGAERFSAMVLDDNALGTSLWAASNYVQQDLAPLGEGSTLTDALGRNGPPNDCPIEDRSPG